jgi:hypothetical protein
MKKFPEIRILFDGQYITIQNITLKSEQLMNQNDVKVCVFRKIEFCRKLAANI